MRNMAAVPSTAPSPELRGGMMTSWLIDNDDSEDEDVDVDDSDDDSDDSDDDSDDSDDDSDDSKDDSEDDD